MTGLLSPTSGRSLRADGPDVLTDGAERWPVLDGIPFLRTGREDLVRDVLAAIDRGDREGALVRLLVDQDDWWDGAPPAEDVLRRLVRERDVLPLRDAMHLLGLGRVGDYFAHRWSDPTYLAGLALLDAHWSEPADAFELACGIGHYLRDLSLRGVEASGADVVFAKLWLARHWVVGPDVRLSCFDARSPWPVSGVAFDLVFCHDAYYFLEPKAEILRNLRGLVRPSGTLAIAHVHNSGAANLSAGSGISAREIAATFPDATVYDDAELTRAAAAGRAPVSQPPESLAEVEAFSLVEGQGSAARAAAGPLCSPRKGASLRRNPLYTTGAGEGATIRWPSERYRSEYAPGATYSLSTSLADKPRRPSLEAFRRREVLDLPERW